MTQITDNGNLDDIEQFRALERKISSTDEESQSTTDETVKNDGDEGVIVENGDNAEINESIEPVSIEPTENGVTEEVSEDKDQVPVVGPSAEDNQATEEDENDDDDEFDDFGDFGDNDDFGDFGDVVDDPPNAQIEVPASPVPAPLPISTTPPPELGALVDDMSRLCLNIEPSDDTTAMSETVSDIDKRVARLFDCVNAGALDFAWRNSNFDSIMAESAPVLIAICEKSDQERRKMLLDQQAMTNAKNSTDSKKQSVEAAELLEKLPDLSWVQR